MKRLLTTLLFVSCAAVFADAQEKGVDQQNERIRDSSNNRMPAVNGSKVDTGAGRGMDFGKGRTPTLPPVANPYRLSFPRDVVLKAAQELMRERKLIPDDAVSKPDEGILISQPYTFIKGAVVTRGELTRLAEVPDTTARGWTRGRYTLIIEVQAIDSTSSNVAVNARVEGRSDSPTGAEWLTLRSTGAAEQDFLIALVERVTGAPPPGREQ